MQVLRQARDLGAERTLALAAAIADDFDRAGWTFSEYRWLVLSSDDPSVIELTFESTNPAAIPPGERPGSGLELEHPGEGWFFLTWILPAIVFATVVVVFLVYALLRH